MTNSRQVLAMIRSHAAGDSQQFLAIAEHIAADADRSGRTKVAGEIRGMVEDARRRGVAGRSEGPIPIAAPRGELAGLVRASYPETRVSDLVLGPDLRRKVTRLVREHREGALLRDNGLEPRRKFLFSGPPGTGKTMTASAIAGELGLPLFSILLDGVITKYMGETAAKLRLVFDAMRSVRGVYLFDEVDALAGRRDAENDIGEARRTLNSFLLFLEEDRSSSLVVAASNHRALLDPALFRRFDSALVYAKPTVEEARQVLRNHLLRFDVDALDWSSVDLLTPGLSQADLVSAAADAARDAVLDDSSVLKVEVLCRALSDRVSIHDH